MLFFPLRKTTARRSAAGLTLGLALLAACPVHAQTTEYRTSLSLGAINYEDRNAPTSLLHGYLEQGAATLTASGEATYSFGEGSGAALGAASDTVRLSGSGFASALGFGFTDLKASVTVALENAYLDERNVENAPENNGMKASYFWIADASAGWTLTSRFQGATVAGNSYTVKWIFRADGVENTINGGYGFAYLGFTYGANPSSDFQTTSLLPQMWATDSAPVMWGEAVETRADFHANWQYSLLQEGTPVSDGSGQIGFLAPALLGGTVNYASTTTLEEIQVFDQNGNRFYDFTVDNGNGTQFYNGNAAAVAAPEPETLRLMLLGTLLTLPIGQRCRWQRVRRRAHVK